MIRSVAHRSEQSDGGAFPPFERASGRARPADPRGLPPYLEGLNAEQLRAVEALDGPVLVLAGAGVGKTRVLTTRIAHLIASGRARPHEILAVTFTNKAAREMRERVRHVHRGRGQGCRGSARSIRSASRSCACTPSWSACGRTSPSSTPTTSERLIKQILQAENIDDKRWPARALAGLIDDWKNRGLDPEHCADEREAAFAGGRGAALYAALPGAASGAERRSTSATFCCTIADGCSREHPDVLARASSAGSATSWSTSTRTPTSPNISGCACWPAPAATSAASATTTSRSTAGAAPRWTTSCGSRRDFPGAKVIRLERNYRSGGHILAVASGLIAHNLSRLGKTLLTDAPQGERPTVTGVWDSEEEARVIGDEIEQAQRAGVSLDDIAILVRASFQMREFEERFIAVGLPYKVIGGPRFYERAEIRDALAYLRCVAQPDDDLAFERIDNQPKRGLGEATLATLHAYGRRAGVSPDAGRARR